MRTRLVGGVGLGLLAVLLLNTQDPTAGQDKGPRWLTDYGEARTTASKNGKPILAVFR